MYLYGQGEELFESSPAEKDLGVLVDEKLDMASSVRLQPGRPTVFWAALKQGWPAGRGDYCAPLLSPCEAPSGVLALGPQYRKDVELLSGSRGGPLR